MKLKETLLTICLLRPVVDAYRVSTNNDDGSLTADTITEMMVNKAIEPHFVTLTCPIMSH